MVDFIIIGWVVRGLEEKEVEYLKTDLRQVGFKEEDIIEVKETYLKEPYLLLLILRSPLIPNPFLKRIEKAYKIQTLDFHPTPI